LSFIDSNHIASCTDFRQLISQVSSPCPLEHSLHLVLVHLILIQLLLISVDCVLLLVFLPFSIALSSWYLLSPVSFLEGVTAWNNLNDTRFQGSKTTFILLLKGQ
jgi:hypothetical protein